jgi:hypothetical protein
MKKVITIFFILCLNFIAYTQSEVKEDEKTSKIDLGADFMSRYVWRGVDWGGESPSIQPFLTFEFGGETHAFSAGTWAAYNFNTSNQEVDIILNYTFKEAFSLIFTDYYFPGTADYTASQQDYFNFKQDSTGHLFEGTLSFNGTDNIPFTFLFSMNLYGYDAYKMNDDSSRGDIMRSKYIEVGYQKSIRGVDFTAFIGAALDNPDENKGETGYYLNESAGIINIGVKAEKAIKFSSSFELPIQSSLIVNPEAQKIFLVFGISL